MKTTKKRISSLLVLLAMLSMLTYSCKKEEVVTAKEVEKTAQEQGMDTENDLNDFESEQEQNQRVRSVLGSDEIVSTVIVQVVNQNEEVQPGAEVEVMNMKSITDERGMAIFESMSLNTTFVRTTVSKLGYERAIKTITPSDNRITNINVMLLNDVPERTLNAATGGLIETDGVKLDFPSGALVDKAGAVFSGHASVNLVYYAMDNEDAIRSQPGTLVGITNDNEMIGLVSEGMITVDIFDENGNELQLGNGKKVSVEMPASPDGPAQIQLWHLNETYGLWVESGTAVKDGSVYKFDAVHFSTYNLDFPLDRSLDFCVDISYANGNPTANQFFKIFYKNERGDILSKCLSTDDTGRICLLRGLPGEYIFAENECSQFSKVELNVAAPGNYSVVLDPQGTRTYMNVPGTLRNCEGEPFSEKFFSFAVDNVPNEDVTELFVGQTDAQGNFAIYKTLCGSYSGIENATLRVTESSGTRKNTFPFDLSKTTTRVDLNICGDINNFQDIDVLTLDDCLTRLVLSRRDRTGSNTILYFDVKNIKELGSGCNDFLSCLDFENLQQLYYFTALETLAFYVPNDETEIDFSPLANLKSLERIILIGSEEENMAIIEELSELLPNVEVQTVFSCVIY